MSVTAVRTPAEYEAELQRYLFERAEEGRAVRVGEKEVSERAEIVARYRELFTRDQLDALKEAEGGLSGAERERVYRLRKTCESGLADIELSEREDALENAILAARVDHRGEDLPLRSAQAKLAVIADYAEREELGQAHGDVSASFNDDRMELLRAREELDAELSGEADPIGRNEEEKGISLRALSSVLSDASKAADGVYGRLSSHWFDALLGDDRPAVPTSYHVGWLRRLSPLESTYGKDRATEVCLETVKAIGFDLSAQPNIKLDLDDRPQKSPRACVIAADPPRLVHLITRAQGGLHDYQAFLHEAGHALHYGNCDPELPYTFRNLSRDHALTEIYSYIFEAISREPEWHLQHFSLSEDQAAENAQATVFLEALLYRRYTAKLEFEIEFWSDFGSGNGELQRSYSEKLTEATGINYRADAYLADMDAGFYSADYLRAWIRSAQLREWLQREVGEDWWRNTKTGDHLRALFAEGTQPTSEDIAARLGFDPHDTKPLLSELGA
jgi:hypothetical protein